MTARTTTPSPLLRLEAMSAAWTLANGSDTAHERNLPYAAAVAASPTASARCRTRRGHALGREILGIAGHHGSLESGKSALVITNGDILEASTVVEIVLHRQPRHRPR